TLVAPRGTPGAPRCRLTLVAPRGTRGAPGLRVEMIGESHARLGGERLVTGAGRFVEDVRVPRRLHAAVLRSPPAHARPAGLPACPSVAAAVAPGAPRLFAGTETNNVATIAMRVGDADAALARAAVVIRERFRYPRQTAAALETRGLVAVPPDPRGGELHLIGATKCIHINRTILAPIFGIPLGALRLTEVDVGGGFGVRGELYPEDILVPLAAMKLGRPVRWIESRRENLMAANHAREVGYEIEIGFDADGRILAIRTVIHADIGVYVRTAALVPAEFGAALLPGQYRVPHFPCDLWSVVTNKTPAGTLRSPGRPECNFVRERLLDAGAARLGLDPAEIRRRNLIRPDEMPYDFGTQSFGVTTVYYSGDFPALFVH